MYLGSISIFRDLLFYIQHTNVSSKILFLCTLHILYRFPWYLCLGGYFRFCFSFNLFSPYYDFVFDHHHHRCRHEFCRISWNRHSDIILWGGMQVKTMSFKEEQVLKYALYIIKWIQIWQSLFRLKLLQVPTSREKTIEKGKWIDENSHELAFVKKTREERG